MNGYVVQGRGVFSSSRIFLPATGGGAGTEFRLAGSYGYYWSSVPAADYNNYSWNTFFSSSSGHSTGYGNRLGGYPVRPVQGLIETAVGGHTEDSAPFLLDTIEGTRIVRDVESIFYSTAWEYGAPANAVAVIELDGVVLNSSAGSGFVEWTPIRNDTYTFTHKVLSGGTQYGETLTAMFLVDRSYPDAPVFSPMSGTTFDSFLSVSISCPTEGAVIHYTTNGIVPTMESTVYRRFRIYGKTTVKAVAELNGVLSDVVVAEYAMGRCTDPIVSPVDGTVFEHSNQEVSITGGATDGILRYTVDGSDPTVTSPAYEGPFTISESTVVKAKVFGENYFDSAVVTTRLLRAWTMVSTPVINAAPSFTGSKTKVSISCVTEGADIHYTLNGNDPNLHSTRYVGPFDVMESCTVKAYATKTDYLASTVATQVVEKVWGIGDTMGDPDQMFTTDGNGGHGWIRVVEAMAPNGEAMKSGAIMHNQSSVLSTTVTGSGTLTFAWRTSCEKDPDGYYEWDHVELVLDGTVIRCLDGMTTWQNEYVVITGDGEHTIEWQYVKDDAESEGEDAAWVAAFKWEPTRTATQTTDLPVPYEWLRRHVPNIADEYEAYEAAAKKTAANGRKVWECYVLGLDPEVATNEFRIVSFPMKVDGTPDLANIVFEPPQAQWNEPATYKVMGAVTLGGPWVDVSSGGDSSMRFFKVEVRLIGVPTDVTASSWSETAVNLMWSAVADATGYEVWRGTGMTTNGAERISIVSDATSYTDTAAVMGTTYHYWIRSVSGDVFGNFSDPVVGMRLDPHCKVQLWKGGPYWAETNIGAEEPWEYGYYFWWGDIIGYKRENDLWVASDGSSSNFSFPRNAPTSGKDLSALQSGRWIGAGNFLTQKHDAAQVQWGGGWRIPTDQELSDLIGKCDWTWTTTNGVNGYVVCGRGDYASASIFLPAAGYGDLTSLHSAGWYGVYWTSYPYYLDGDCSWGLGFYPSSIRCNSNYVRSGGLTIRPVQGETE